MPPPLTLKTLREARFMSREGLANRIGVSVRAAKAWELGERTPNREHWPKLAEALAVPVELIAAAVGDPLALPNGQNGDVVGWLDRFVQEEQRARVIWGWELWVVDGLLQTSDYARAVESTAGDGSVQWEAHTVEARMARQQILRGDDPTRLNVVVAEAVLWNAAGDVGVMARQLDYLAEVAVWPNVDLRVMPFGRSFVGASGAFSVVASPHEVPSMAFMHTASGVRFLNLPAEIDAQMERHRELTDAALDRDETVSLIKTIRQERYTT